MPLKNINPIKTKIWESLTKHYKCIKNKSLKDLFKNDEKRFDKFSIHWNDLFIDYSKNHINNDTKNLLIKLANYCFLPDAIKKMFSGDMINITEKRKVLHTALRDENFYIDKYNVSNTVKYVLNKMKIISNNIINGNWKGYTNEKITDIVNIGIGGSHLGPMMITNALKNYKNNLNIHFVSNIDSTNIFNILKKISPKKTLFIISSKSFDTEETIMNANTARKWFLEDAISKKNISKHFIALSSNINKVKDFGINEKNIFPLWSWVGGRFSIWSSIGLTICLSIGYSNFKSFLKGAHKMDEHFKNTPLNNNIPVLLGLIGIWYINFFGLNNHIILSYDEYLCDIYKYLQQLDMESNGKNIDRNGNFISYSTSPIIWGGVGTNVQHSFFQLLHQGTIKFSCDFIVGLKSLNNNYDHHSRLFSNFLAQSRALAFGNEIDNNINPNNFKKIFKYIKGNNPSNSILFKKLTPSLLGSLISMYEHKIFVQGVIWNIFSFDQWGVEFGKKLSKKILLEITNKNINLNYDSSTNGLINLYIR